MSASNIISEEDESEREPLKGAMDNRAFEHPSGNSQVEFEVKQDETPEVFISSKN